LGVPIRPKAEPEHIGVLTWKRATGKKWVLWFALIMVPIISVWIYGLIAAREGYEGTCGLLNKSSKCTEWQFIEQNLSSAFGLAPELIAVSLAWVLIIAIIGVISFLFRRADGKRRA
jgi:hypothetical protein